MRNFAKAKALERLYAELSKFEMEYNVTPNYGTSPYQINLMQMDMSYILDVLAKAIAEERSER